MSPGRSRRGGSPLLLALLLAVGTVACVSAPVPSPSTGTIRPELNLPATLRVRTRGTIVTVSLEDYVVASALSEVSPVGDAPGAVNRIFEVQAILARTYAITNIGRHRSEGYDLCDETHCQLYEPARLQTSRFAATARAAVLATRGQVLIFDGRPARALFHADCGGHTASADSVWTGRPVSYLTGLPDTPPAVSHRKWTFAASMSQLADALARRAGQAPAGSPRAVRVAVRDASGRAARIDVLGTPTVSLTGEEFRRAVNEVFGATALRSTRFDVTADRQRVTFAGTGFGHGVGLCQVGAAARARHGDTAAQILAVYFPGTRIAEPPPVASDLITPPIPVPRSPRLTRLALRP